MNVTSVDEIVQKALALNLIEQRQVQDLWVNLGTQNVPIDVFRNALLRQGHLTKYQVERLMSGETTGFYYGDYKVLYPVGSGTFARVFRAVQKNTGKTVAIKVLRSRFQSDPKTINLFQREAELGIDLHHPNIVPVHTVCSDKSGHYIVMDFIEGQTLREFITLRKKVDPKVANRIITDVCRGLDYAFKRGHLHRDLKMTNVILSSGGKAILCDFGLATDDEEENHLNQRAIDYAVLERSTHVPRDDKRSDIFFLGTIYYNLLTGVAPLIETRDRAKRLDKTRFLNIRPISQIDPTTPLTLAFIIDKAMQMKPEKRYQSPGAMLADLEIATRKLELGTANDDPRQNQPAATSSLSLATVAKKEKRLATIMVVEANPEMQNIFRESLKRIGFRVLLLTSAERAMERINDNDQELACVLFNAQSLGKNAVLAFNQMADSPHTLKIPAILLLDEGQVKWAGKAARNKHRLTVAMPISMRRLQEVLIRLITQKKKEKEAQEQNAFPASGQKPSVDSFKVAPQSIPAPTKKIPEKSAESVSRSEAETSIDHSPVQNSAPSNLNLAEDDADYTDYYQENDAASVTKSGQSSLEESNEDAFDAALNDIAESLQLKDIQPEEPQNEVDEVSGLTREAFLAGKFSTEEAEEESNDYLEDYGDYLELDEELDAQEEDEEKQEDNQA